jgi:hypothetical protein
MTSKVVSDRTVAERARAEQAVDVRWFVPGLITGLQTRQWIAGRGQQTGNMELSSI